MSMILEEILAAFDALGPLASTNADCISRLQDVGHFPQPPNPVTTDHDYDVWIASTTAWRTNQDRATTNFEASFEAQLAQEQVIVDLMIEGVWYDLNGLSNWPFENYYISTPIKQRYDIRDPLSLNVTFYMLNVQLETPTE